MNKIKQRKQWIVGFIKTSICIIIGFGVLGFIVYKWSKNYYYNQLEDSIVYRYLENKNAIGTYSFDMKMSPELNPSGYTYTNDLNAYLTQSAGEELKRTPSGAGIDYDFEYIFDNSGVINKLSDAKVFKWFTAYGFSPLKCMIIKKTNRGFDFIDKKIIGIGFTTDLPNSSLEEKVFKYTPPDSLLGKSIFHQPHETKTVYYTDLNLYNQYINNLLDEEYNDIYWRQDSDNKKYNLLSGLRQKQIVSGDQSLYFGNEFYELKTDKYYTYIGSGEITRNINTFGNQFWTLYSSTTTVHYSIQERANILECLILKITIYTCLSIILIYAIFGFIKCRKIANPEKDESFTI